MPHVLLKISSKRTLKLYTLDFSENLPWMAYSGDISAAYICNRIKFKFFMDQRELVGKKRNTYDNVPATILVLAWS